MGSKASPEKRGANVARKRFVVFLAMLAALSLVAASCGGDDDGGGAPVAQRGGIFRIQTDAYEWTGALDPTGEYLGFAFEFYNMIHRSLFGYNYRSGAKGGNDVKPDLSEDDGTVSADGKTYTFKIRQGVKYAPPINRQVSSRDVQNALNRAANPTLNATGYPSYYRDIEGFTAVEKKTATTVSGVTAPDDKTLVIKLLRPVADLRLRLTLAATAPMPIEVSKCATKAGAYGRIQIASGPYMIEGTDKLVPTSCATIKPISGFDPSVTNGFLKVRRNPNYDQSTDKNRANNIDGVDLTLNTNTDDIFKKIEEGTVDGESAQPPSTVLSKFSTQADLKDNLKLDPGDRTWYLFFNMLKPPFDDLAVRRAANFITDKAGLVRARGGTLAGVVAEHMIPPDVLGGKLKQGEFDPFVSAGHSGDLTKAKEEMKKSKYDTNQDGICDAAVCNNVSHTTRATAPYPDMAPIIEQSFAKIGIKLRTQEVASFYSTVQVPLQTPALGSGAGWGKDFASASTYFIPLLTSGAIGDTATQNYSYLGIKSDQVRKLGFTTGRGYNPAGGNFPIDADVDACIAVAADKANDCWANLDKKVSTEYVPWVPYLWANNYSVLSDAVVQYEYDQFAGEVSFVNIALDTTKQKTG